MKSLRITSSRLSNVLINSLIILCWVRPYFHGLRYVRMLTINYKERFLKQGKAKISYSIFCYYRPKVSSVASVNCRFSYLSTIVNAF